MNTPNQAKNEDFFMIDTVAIKLRHPAFTVKDLTLFEPWLNIKEFEAPKFEFTVQRSDMGKRKYRKYTQNKTAQDRRNSTYKPNLTVYERFDWQNRPTYDLHIEFSVPKSIFGNSVQELGEEHFGLVIRTLRQNLLTMGIETSEEALRKGVVAKIHFAKNMQFFYPLTAYDVITALYKADMGRGKDINIREFRNGGFALYFYATSYNIIFYDKLKDIATPTNKAIDKDWIKSEKLFVKNNAFDYQIMRFEIRLAKQTKVNSFLSEVIDRDIESITFEEVFKKEICQKALLKTWGEIADAPINQLAFKMENSPEEIFDEMAKTFNPKNAEKKIKMHSLTKTLASFGMYSLIKAKSARWIRDRVERNWTPKTWSRLSKDIKESATALKIIPDLKAIEKIKSALDEFERFDWNPPSGPLL
jgi:hypothetical protein